MLITGINPVLETLDFDSSRIEKILILNTISNSRIDKIIEIAGKKKIPVEKTPRSRFDELLIEKKDKSEGVSQGVIAISKEFQYCGFAELLDYCKDKKESVIVVLDEITDPHNLGAIIRTAAAAGVDGIIISEKNSAKVNHTVIKTSAGATNYIRISLISNIYNAVKSLSQSNFFIYGAAMKKAKNLYETVLNDRMAIVFGSEGKGIRTNIINLCDEMVSIPMTGKIESLNVSVSAGVILYEVLRQRTAKNPV